MVKGQNKKKVSFMHSDMSIGLCAETEADGPANKIFQLQLFKVQSWSLSTVIEQVLELTNQSTTLSFPLMPSFVYRP
jgi:hypothetical protein